MIFPSETKETLLEMLAWHGNGGEGWCNYLEGLFIPSSFSLPEDKIIVQPSQLEHCIKSEIRKYLFIRIIAGIRNSDKQNDLKALFTFFFFALLFKLSYAPCFLYLSYIITLRPSLFMSV